MSPARAERYSRMAREVNRSVTGYMLGNILTSLIAGTVVFVTLLILGVPFPFLWALWVALVDFLPMIGGALAGIPTVLFATAHSLTAGIVTLIVFLVYTQIENHVLNPVVMSRTVKVNPLLVLLSILVGASIGSWIGGIFGAFVAALLSIPAAGAIQVLVREIWQSTAPQSARRACKLGPGEVRARKPRCGEPRSGEPRFRELGPGAAPPTLLPLAVDTWPCAVSYDLDTELPKSDVVMMLRVQQERMTDAYFPSVREYSRRYGLDAARMGRLPDHAIVLHPGPMNRGVEIAAEVADSARSMIVEQVANGVTTRMAVLYLLLGGTEFPEVAS